ncbi:14 kDa phosphohistidine phosphatase, variant 2 [Trebouxia sp. C0009 RCD-2024]
MVARSMQENGAAERPQPIDTKSRSPSHTQLLLIVTHGDYVLLASLQDHPTSYGPLSGCIQDEEQQQQAAGRIAKQLTGVSIDEASVTPLQAASHTLQAHTCKRQTENGASGLDLLQGQARQCAEEVRLQAHEVDAVLAHPPPLLQLDQAKLADARWFNKRWLIGHSKGQVAASLFRLVLGKDAESPGPMHAWLQEAQTHSPLDQIPDVTIETGVFKYVLLVVTDVAEGRSKLIVRGDRQSGYHMDVYEKANRELAPHKLHVAEPLGGGRIRHDDGAKAITVYGYSSAYGQAPHDLSAALIRQWYPMYTSDNITASYEGY